MALKLLTVWGVSLFNAFFPQGGLYVLGHVIKGHFNQEVCVCMRARVCVYVCVCVCACVRACILPCVCAFDHLTLNLC